MHRFEVTRVCVCVCVCVSRALARECVCVWVHSEVNQHLKDSFTPELIFPDNLLTPMSSKMFMSFFLQSKINVSFF